MFYSFLILLREGMEAALIVGILMAYLVKVGAANRARPVLWGALLALAVSAAGGAVLHQAADRLSGPVMEVFEGVMMILAAVLLTYMVVWMRRQARGLRAEIHERVDMALGSGSVWALTGLSFLLVIREGLETVVFLAAGANYAGAALPYAAGAVAGGVLAAALGYLLYRGTLRLDLRLFFNLTGLLLIVFAAGLLANAVRELQEVGFLPRGIAHVWDTYHLLPDTTPFGRMLAALFGYDASPSLTQVTAFFGYLALVGVPFWMSIRQRPAPGLARAS